MASLIQMMLAMAAVSGTGVAAESISLNQFISIAASLGSELAPSTTSSRSRSTQSSTHSKTASSTLSTSATPSSSSISAATTPTSGISQSASNAAASQSAAPSNTGIDPHTRTIIIAVCVVVGLLLLALLLGLCLCLRRRRKRAAEHEPVEKRRKRSWKPALLFARKGKHGHQRHPSEESIADNGFSGGAGNRDWEKHNSDHHGFMAGAAAVPVAHHAGRSHSSEHGLLNGHQHDSNGRPSMQRPPTNEHPAFRNSVDEHGHNPLVSQQAPARKPVPSNGHNHHAGELAAVGAGVGIGAMYKHHQHKNEEDRAHHAQPLAHNPPVDSRIDRPGTSGEGWPLSREEGGAGGFVGAVSSSIRNGNRHSLPASYQQVHNNPGIYSDNENNAGRRKSYEEGFDDSRYSHEAYHRDSTSLPLAAGAGALAGAGAMAHHEHKRHSDGEYRNSDARTSYDANRPPTPMGLGRATQPSPPTPAQRLSLQKREAQHYRDLLQQHENQERMHSREALAPSIPMIQRPALAADRSSERVSYGGVSTSSGSTGLSSGSSGQRVPTAAIGAVGRDSARILSPEPATSPLAHAVSRSDVAGNERTPLASAQEQRTTRPSLLTTHAPGTEAFDSDTTFWSTKQGSDSRNSSYVLPTPTPPMQIPGSFPGDRTPQQMRGSSEPPYHGYSNDAEYDPFSSQWAGVGSGRRSLGATGTSPARNGGVVRFSDRDEEWRYDDGDDYSDRGGGGGNVYDGYRYDSR